MHSNTPLTARPISPHPAPAPRLKSQDLFRGGYEIVIEHHGAEYRLRLTRNDKLILNK